MSAPSMKTLFAQSAARAGDSPQPSLSADLAGLRCPRDAWYRAEGKTPVEKSRILARAFERALDAMAEESDLDVLTHRSVKIEMGGVRVRGTADAVFVDENGPTLSSRLHVVGDDVWERAKLSALEGHRADANLLAYGLGCAQWSVCYVHARTGELAEHIGVMDPFAARRDFGLLEEVAYWMRVGIPPPRPFEDFEKDTGEIKLARDHEPCRGCPNRTQCWQIAANPTEEKKNDVALSPA